MRPLREITGEALFNEVFLDDVFVPDDCLVGELGDGWKLARTTLANERVAMATTRLSKSTERAVTLASELPLTEAQRVRVGRAVALSTVCTLLGVRTTLRSLAGQGPGAESSVAKLLGVRNRQDGAELVVDLQGDGLVAPRSDELQKTSGSCSTPAASRSPAVRRRSCATSSASGSSGCRAASSSLDRGRTRGGSSAHDAPPVVQPPVGAAHPDHGDGGG